MNAQFEKYIEGLSPELQEKARACKTKEELNAFIAENDLELPEDALELVSGGCGTSTPPPKKPYCKKCGAVVEETNGIGPMTPPYRCPNKCISSRRTIGDAPGFLYRVDVEWR